ncbi:MAG: F0F1 ATP synthase subunit delta [Opitutales bacterium]
MRADRKLKDFARKLVALSRAGDGLVDEGRVGEILAALRQHPPRRPKTVLKLYLHGIERALREGTALVEHAGPLESDALESIRSAMANTYDRPLRSESHENADLLAGIRVRVADDVYDASAAGRLKRLAAQVH